MSEISRHLRIALLLESSDWYLDEFTIRSRAFSGGSGTGAERRVTCPKCEGIGRTRSGNKCGQCWHGSSTSDHSCEQCGTCEGKGKVWVNRMLGKSGEIVPAPEKTKSAKGSGGAKAKRAREPRDLSADVDNIVKARVLRDRSGSYEALERLLRSLKTSDEMAHYLVLAMYREQRWGRPRELLRPTELLDGEPRPNVKVAELGHAESMAVLRGLVFLDKGMPKDIRVPREHLAPMETKAGLSITAQARSKSGRARSRARRWAA